MKMSTTVALSAIAFSGSLLAHGLVFPRSDGTSPSPSHAHLEFDAVYSPRLAATNSSGSQGGVFDVINDMDIGYYIKITVAGSDFTVQLDSGSSDLWVNSPSPLTVTNETDTSVELTYGIGAVYGKVAYAPCTIGNYTMPTQAFLNVNKAVQQDGNQGIFPLGLDRLSVVYGTVSQKSGALYKPAQPPLSNIFELDNSQPNFIALGLKRSEDSETTAGGVFSISAYDPNFSNVSTTPKIPIAPANTSRWTIALDGMNVNGENVTLKSDVPGAAPNTSIALIDSGTTLAYIPEDAVNLIYSSIAGAVRVKDDQNYVWVVPCLGQTNVVFTFENQPFAVNPLDLTTVQTITQDEKNFTICVSSFRPQLGVASNEVDYLLGDVFMRNVYSVFNFGNGTLSGNFSGTPSLQLLSITDQTQAAQDFNASRSALLQSYPEQIDPRDVKS